MKWPQHFRRPFCVYHPTVRKARKTKKKYFIDLINILCATRPSLISELDRSNSICFICKHSFIRSRQPTTQKKKIWKKWIQFPFLGDGIALLRTCSMSTVLFKSKNYQLDLSSFSILYRCVMFNAWGFILSSPSVFFLRLSFLFFLSSVI